MDFSPPLFDWKRGLSSRITNSKGQECNRGLGGKPQDELSKTEDGFVSLRIRLACTLNLQLDIALLHLLLLALLYLTPILINQSD